MSARHDKIISRTKVLLRGEPLFLVSMVLALGSSAFVRPEAKSIDWRVIAQLFSLMVVVQALKKFMVLEYFANGILKRFDNQRAIAVVLIAITAFSAAFMTNDVALITLVPLTLILAEKSGFDPVLLVILQSQAANIGSAITPMGNPQNLFLYSRYSISAASFFETIFPFTLVGMVLTFLFNLKYRRRRLDFSLRNVKIESPARATVFGVAFVLVMLSVFRMIDYRIAFILILVAAVLLARELLMMVDYFLLGTFVFFFVFIDNVSRVEVIAIFMRSISAGQTETLMSSALFSQLISNVPSAILFSSFTDNYRALLLGVNIGGSGTIIASLANLIAYKIYVKERGNGKEYLSRFTFISFFTLGVTILTGLLALRVL